MLPETDNAIACLLTQMESIDLPITQNRKDHTLVSVRPIFTRLGVEYCAVCGDQADGYHYGVLSCRGCNAFFRRAITHKLQFQCRRGGNCVIDRNARCACRACRLNACKLAGMDRSAVQIRHDSHEDEASSSQLNSQPTSSTTSVLLDTIGARSSDKSPELKSSSHSRESSSQAGGGSPTTHQIDPTTTTRPVKRDSSTTASHQSVSSALRNLTPPLGGGSTLVFGSAALLASTSATRSYLVLTAECNDSGDNSMGFLTQMVEDYFDQRRRRRSMLCTTVEEILNDGVEEICRLRQPAGLDDFTSIYRTQMIVMFEWVEKLKEFQLIKSAHDRVKLIRAFAMKYLLLDNLYYTLEMGYSDRVLLVNNTFVQPIHPTTPLLNVPVPAEYGKAISIGFRLYGENCAQLLKEILHPMIRMQLTFGEIMAIRLIVFWNPQHSLGLSEDANEIIHRASERALQELHGWYAENRFDELRQRLSNLLLLLSPLMKHSQHLSELASLIPEFGMPEWDSFWMNELLQ